MKFFRNFKKKKPEQIFVIILLYGFLFSSAAAFEENSKHELELSKILGELDRNEFLSNKNGDSFSSSFGDINKLQKAKNNIFIEKGSEIYLENQFTHEFSTILIEGTFQISETGEFPLRAQKIVVLPEGKLIIGTEKNPIASSKRAEIIFIKKVPGEVGLFVFGELSIHGSNVNPTFVELLHNAKPGDDVIVVNESVKKWKTGDQIVITSPGNHDKFKTCTEKAEIASVEGTFIHLIKSLNCFHTGKSDNSDFPSHVALLSRNVVFQSEDLKNRGSVKFFFGSTGIIKFAEFSDLGSKNVMGKYPIHFHKMGESSRGLQVIGNSIVNSDNRWITIHHSNGIEVKNNVGYNSIGHGFFLEDGWEFENTFENNIGIKTKSGNLISSDSRSSVFWSMNPQNNFKKNVAVEGWYYGFTFEIINKKVTLPNSTESVNLASLTNLEFADNISYDNGHAGMKIFRPKKSIEPPQPPTLLISNLKVLNEFDDKFSQWGMTIDANDVKIVESKFVDFPIGIDLFGSRNVIERTEIVRNENENFEPSIGGVVVGGKDNIIKESKIEGYDSITNQLSSDIALKSFYFRQPLSINITNTKLMDEKPIIFGQPLNDESYIAVFNYDAPNGPKYSEPNFLLKKFDYDKLRKTRNLGNELDFFASVVPLYPLEPNDGSIVSFVEKKGFTSEERNLQLIETFKKKAFEWREDSISNDEFLEEIKVLIDSEIILISYSDEENFYSNIIIPDWLKLLVTFWNDDFISNEEFTKALEYVLEILTEGAVAYE